MNNPPNRIVGLAVKVAASYPDEEREVVVPEEKKWRCPDCDGLNVEAKLWVALNSLRITDEYDKDDEGWCSDCDDSYFLEFRIKRSNNGK